MGRLKTQWSEEYVVKPNRTKNKTYKKCGRCKNIIGCNSYIKRIKTKNSDVSLVRELYYHRDCTPHSAKKYWRVYDRKVKAEKKEREKMLKQKAKYRMRKRCALKSVRRYIEKYSLTESEIFKTRL